MHAELFFYIHLHASMGSAAAAGWSIKREDAAVQFDSLGSAASTVISLSMLRPVRWPRQLRLLRGQASRHVFFMGVRPARRQLWRQAQRPAIPGGSAAQPPLRQGGAGGQGQLAACSAGLSHRRDLQQ